MNVCGVYKPTVICSSIPLRKTQKRKCVQALVSNLKKELQFVNEHCDTNVSTSECVASWERIALQSNYIYDIVKTLEDTTG